MVDTEPPRNNQPIEGDLVMGLDGAELVMEIEEAFDISISNEAAQKMRTVGDVYQYVLNHRKDDASQRPPICLTAVTFYKLRRLFVSELGLDRGQLRPGTPTDSILPQQDRNVVWSRLEKTLQLKLPDLALPQPIEKLCWLVPALLGVLLAAAMLKAFPPAVATLAGSVCFLILLMASHGATVPWATLPTPAFATLGGLARIVMAENLATIRQQHAGPNPTDTCEILQAIIVAQLGVDPKDVTPSASFVYDLGIG
jgi:acyl carrier protein